MSLTRDEMQRRKRLTWAMKKPRLALEGGWVQDPKFCADLFDRCDQMVFVQAPEVLEIARRAVEIADVHGDPHLLHRGHGVLAHAYIARRDPYWAHKTLKEVREQALACCPRCRCDHFQRLGDLLMEERKLDDSLEVLDRALEDAHDLEDDLRGRIHFVRGITHHLLGRRDRALADAQSTLELMSLSSPHGYFADTAALVANYVGGGDPRHDAAGSAMLKAFDQRIKGKRGWADWITRRSWADAHLQARQGNFRRARTLMQSAYTRVLVDGLPRETVAAALDLGQLKCRAWDVPPERYWRDAIALTQRCLDRRPDLTDTHREGLGEILDVLNNFPEHAFDQMVQLRRSFIVSVPGVMAERLRRRGE